MLLACGATGDGQLSAHRGPIAVAPGNAGAAGPSDPKPSGPSSSTPSPSSSSSSPSSATSAALADALCAELDPVADASDGRLSVAVLDTGSGASAVYADASYDTASIVKVDILATLMLQAQDAGRSLTDRERSYATDMIEHSDNDAATALWNAIGGADALDAANQRLGLSRTHGGTTSATSRQSTWWWLGQARR